MAPGTVHLSTTAIALGRIPAGPGKMLLSHKIRKYVTELRNVFDDFDHARFEGAAIQQIKNSVADCMGLKPFSMYGRSRDRRDRGPLEIIVVPSDPLGNDLRRRIIVTADMINRRFGVSITVRISDTDSPGPDFVRL